MHDFSDIITKVTAECDTAIQTLKEANAGYSKDKPPIEVSKLGSQTVIKTNISVMGFVKWNQDSLVSFTRAKEHLEDAIKQLEGWRAIFKDVLTTDSDPAFLNGPNGPKSDSK